MNGYSYFLAEMLPIKYGNQKTLYYATSNNLLLHYLAKRRNTKITFFTQLDCVTRIMHLCAVFLKKRNCHLCLTASNICQDSKISH